MTAIPDTAAAARALFGPDPSDALYRALWISIADCGLDDCAPLSDADRFRAYYDFGGCPNILVPLDPVGYPDIVPLLREYYHLPDANWKTLQAALADDFASPTLYDPVTDQNFFVIR